MLIQPSNQGTAPAILYSLLRLREVDPHGVVAFFPSDHPFSDDEAFTGHIDSACAAAESRPEMVILLGIPPDTPEAGYGWIEPGIPLGSPVPDSVCRVSRFWEKPDYSLASTLMEAAAHARQTAQDTQQAETEAHRLSVVQRRSERFNQISMPSRFHAN